jgi:NADH:ubiquinone oxidoreductase subunit 5 (subunit L)/multisubunit Na+/H+ antiporter MnhA subunit
MDPVSTLPVLLGLAWLVPLASFTLIVFFGPRMGKHGSGAGKLATAAIATSCALSLFALFAVWLPSYDMPPEHHAAHADEAHGDGHHEAGGHGDTEHKGAAHAEEHKTADAGHHSWKKPYIAGEWYVLGQFGKLRVAIGYYIDSLTVTMFAMVTFIATCIHFYANGYMHDELHDITDHEVTLSDGHHLHRPGRFHRFFQYLSLFCFSMLGIVIAGNIAMVFVFWELVGICSYFLIGFYIERKSASTAANKAFIVNRVGDFGMIIGLMIIFATLGTFTFGDIDTDGDNIVEPGIFSQVRSEANHYALVVPDGMVKAAAAAEIAKGVEPTPEQIEKWRADMEPGGIGRWAYWLLILASLGIFCGCVGKSAQFPLHVWLPDAMEGPTPVSALVHSATMVAAGVYLVGRFFPVFPPEALLVIAIIGCITLFIAATMAIVAVDIKRVLAYSTVSQLGYMMLALGVGGWSAGMFHLITHAFFKSLLFMCSGSVIHAVHTNDMTRMGGLRKKMPWTAYTMLVGCLAIMGAGVPFAIGLSGYYSKDAILAQAMNFQDANPRLGWLFYVAAAGAAITAFYMFRLWFMTFAGKPRDHHAYDHAHESPKIMYYPLVVLAVMAIIVGWPFLPVSVASLLEQSRPEGIQTTVHGLLMTDLVHPDEHASHLDKFHVPATIVAALTGFSGLGLAIVFYGVRWLNPKEVATQFRPIYTFLVNKWYFDELYHFLFVKPSLFIANRVAEFDKVVIDGIIDGLALLTRILARLDDLADRYIVDGIINTFAARTYALGSQLRSVETGRVRQYVMFIVVGTVAMFVLISFYMMNYSLAAPPK